MTQRFVRAFPLAFLVSSGVAALSCGSDDDGGGAPPNSSGSGGTQAAPQGGQDGLDLGGALTNPPGSSDGGVPATGCPIYRTRCDGVCLPTNADPDNCGACGTECTGEQACSAGVCSDECAPGLTICDNACVDLANDSAHCGECGQACEAGQGCADGRCVDSVPVGPSPKKCDNGGPPIHVGDEPQDECLGNLAQTTFRWSLCSCTDLNVSAKLSTDAYDSTTGPYKPGELGGGVGVDRDVTNWSEAVTVGGTLWVAGTDQYSSSGPASEVKADLHLGGSWKASTPFNVGGPAYVVGELSGVTVAGKTESVPSVPPACDCAENKLVQVAAIVAAHQTNNDNADIDLDPAVFESPSSALRLDLPCGKFYFTKIETSLDTTIHVHGRTALYVAGDVAASSSLAFVLDAGAELDLFVAGTLKVSDTFVFGSPNYPALSRAYIGGSAKIALSDDVRLAGQLYAANSEQLVWSAKNDIYGSVFAGNFRSSDVTQIHYDRGVLKAGEDCPPGGEGGAGGTECGSCEDCHNQACKNGKCGECGADSDCCAPLICVEGSCKPRVVVK
jgi:hypothetical protein